MLTFRAVLSTWGSFALQGTSGTSRHIFSCRNEGRSWPFVDTGRDVADYPTIQRRAPHKEELAAQ